MTLPDCTNATCRFRFGPELETLVAYEPVSEHDWRNLNTDLNTASGSLSCSTCSRRWAYNYIVSAPADVTFTEIK